MEKIKTLTIVPTSYDSKLDWEDVLAGIKESSSNFDLEQMCRDCIKKQHSYGVRDKKTGELKQTIKCSGLATMKNRLETELGEKVTDEFYNHLLGTAGSSALQKAEEFENSYYWIENNIVDPDVFNPRPHQRMINSCTSNRKVLRMGRRCVSADTELVGKKKNYRAKHLYHLLIKQRRRPLIQVYDDIKSELVYTDKYIVLPNGIEEVFKVTLEDGFSVEVTKGHPILVYHDKHYHFLEAENLEIGMTILSATNKLKRIKAIVKKGKVFTYHISVLKFQTFITKGDIIHHNTGKALCLDTNIPTPSGFRRMGDLQVGDKVFSDKGTPCTITFVTETQLDRDCFRITFSNGMTVDADADHQWNVGTPYLRSLRVGEEEREITVTTKDLLKIKEKGFWSIRKAKPVQYNGIATVDGYSYGNVLTTREDIIDSFIKAPFITKNNFLRGVINRSGIVTRDGVYKIFIKDEEVLKHVLSIATSIGINAMLEKGVVSFSYSFKDIVEYKEESIFIEKIEPIESKPVKCISVDSENSLYLATEAHIITHNTFSMAIGMLHRMLTRKNYEVLMVAPMVTMIHEVVDQLVKFCEELPVNPIVAKSQSPISYIKFNTGSTFKGVPAGASGAKGTRGKSGDLLYMDECLPPSTRIKMADGSYKPLIEIEEGDYVTSFNEETGRMVSKRVSKVKCTGTKDIYEYKTLSGRKIQSTPNHIVWTKEGWVPIENAKNIATLNTRTGTYYFETIVKVRSAGISKVYNMEVEDTHTYIANGFIVHNCDFLSVKDLNSLLAIINDNPDVELWASSTPIGEGNLYKLATDPSFKEFHFPTHVVAHYDDDIDSFNRRNLTDIAYEQEVLANFGASEEAVFQSKFVDEATYYEDDLEESGQRVSLETVRKNRKDFIITMGVDWNRDKVGTRIVVLAYNKRTSLYHILCKETVAKLGWTQVLAIEKVVELNAKYDVDHVYVDDGHGETQASLLRMYGQQRMLEEGYQHPDAKLMETKAVMFGSTLILRDPVSNEEIRKQTKQYMVEHTVNLLSRGNIVLLSEADNDIIMQMKNYTVKSISARGLKTYKARDPQVGDHDLDGLMLALHAIHQEYSELAGNNPLQTLISLVKTPDRPSQISEDPYTVIGTSTNIILNTRKSMATNAFRREKARGFRPRRSLR